MNPFERDHTERDWIAEMDSEISRLTEGSGWIAADLANKLFETLAIHDPALLEGWLIATGKDSLRRWISAHTAARRAQERKRAAAGKFAAYARDFESATDKDTQGERLAGMFAVLHVVDPSGIQKRVSEMTGTDHRFVGNSYQVRGKRALMEAAFHKAVADHIGDKRTDEVYDVENYERLYRSILGESPAPEYKVPEEQPSPPLSEELAAEIREGLAAADHGETEDLGSFAQYAGDLQAVKSVFAEYEDE